MLGLKKFFDLLIIQSNLDILFDFFSYMFLPCQMLIDCQT